MKHLIHVDNSEFFRKQMKSFLAEVGRESESYERGEDAINAIKEGKVNCLITGLELADMSGEELVKRLTVSGEPVPVIVVTSKNDEGQMQRLKALKVKAIVQKSDDWKTELRHLFG